MSYSTEFVGQSSVDHQIKESMEPHTYFEVMDKVQAYGIFTLNASGIVLTWNEGSTIVQSYNETETIGKPFGPLYEKEAEKPQGYFDEVLSKAKQEGLFDEEGWRKRRDGTYYWASIVITPIYDKNKKLLIFTVISRDITKKKLASEIAEITESKLVGPVLSTSNVVWIRDFEGKFTSPHLQWENFTGQNWPEYAGFGWLKMHPKEEHINIQTFWKHLQILDLKEVRNNYQVLQQPLFSEKLTLRTRLWSKIHKEYRHIILSVVPEFNSDGKLIKWTGNEKDVHKARLMELELRETLDKQQLLLSSSRVGLWQLDYKSGRVEIDQHIAHLFNINLSTFNHTLATIIAHMHPDARDSTESALQQSKQTGEPFQVQCKVVWSDATIHFITLRGKVQYNNVSNLPELLLGIGWDITETRSLLEERARTDALVKQQREQTEFVDSICHELRNPLNGIKGYLEEMREALKIFRTIQTTEQLQDWKIEEFSANCDQLQQSIDVIDECAEHQQDVINQVVEISKIEAHKIVLQNNPFILQQVIQTVIAIYEPSAKAKSLKITCDILPEPICVIGDTTRFKQILVNIVSNAIKYTPTSGEIKIQLKLLETKENRVTFELTISDNGIGFTAEQKNSLFERYIPVINHSIAEYESGGLGLAISKGLTQLLGGTITLESEPNKGSIFKLTFNWEAGNTALLPNVGKLRRSTSAPSSTIKKIVLVVDDNRVNRKVLSKLVRKYGFVCEEAEDGQQAVQFYQNLRPDLIFMDIQMPHKDGLQATKEIRELESKQQHQMTPIYAVSGYARDDYKNQAISVGMQGYIVKPFNAEQIEKVLEKHLNVQIFEEGNESSNQPIANK